MIGFEIFNDGGLSRAYSSSDANNINPATTEKKKHVDDSGKELAEDSSMQYVC